MKRKDNKLLTNLPRREEQLLRGHLELVSLETKEHINEIGSALAAIHFPLNAAISLMEVQHTGRSVEVAVIGKEGGTNFCLFNGLTISPYRAMVQIGGAAYRLNIADLQSFMPDIPLFVRMMRRFGMVTLRHAFLSVGCSQLHAVEQRLARWLLAHWQRTGLTQFPFTHEFLAEQLGVQRVTITDALVPFQDKGLVSYGYGKIELLDEQALKKVACPCFQLAVNAIDQYLDDIKTYAPR